MALLSEYVAVELSPPDTERVAEHLERCESCRGIAGAFGMIGPALRQVGGESQDIEAIDHTFALARAGARAARDGNAGVVGDERRSEVTPRQHDSRWWRRMGPAVAMAAGVLLVVGLSQIPEKADRGGDLTTTRFLTKGAGEASDLQQPLVNLSFSVQSSDGTLSRGRNGWRYAPDDLLYFRCFLNRDGYLLMVRIGAEGIEALNPGAAGSDAIAVHRGDWDLSDGTHLLGYSLDQLKGPQRFVALFSPSPFSLTPSLRSALSSSPGLELLRQQNIVTDEVQVRMNH